ncbi:hypothetical protein NX059_007402 [Plenodomus lindquistii]|nr:hypothetical protein NX059_007402 [Plenodomus lindquistii]
MAYTKDYYHILGLRATTPAHQIPTAELRRAYKLALLGAHPDKQGQGKASVGDVVKGAEDNGIGVGGKFRTKGTSLYTVDDVKEAYTILSNPRSKSDYDVWMLHHGSSSFSQHGGGDGETSSGGVGAGGEAFSSDFILGLELLDLSDFKEEEVEVVGDGDGEGEGKEGLIEWTRGCRCGAEKGFRILEGELEDAEGKGEKEVLVGCEGCSLWVRVGFDVEEE